MAAEGGEMSLDRPLEVTEKSQGGDATTGESQNETEEAQAGEEEQATPVTILLSSPTQARTLPKNSAVSLQRLTLIPQPHETIQELKLAINEYIGGYWLGPYSLRIPRGKGRAVHPDEPELERREGVMPIGEGDRLSDWHELADVFAGFKPTDERELETAREPYTDLSARQTVLRLVELISPPGTSEHSMLASLGTDAGSTIFESVRDGLTASPMQEVEVTVPGKKNKGKKEVIKVKKEGAHAFADWSNDRPSIDLAKLPISGITHPQLPCLKDIQVSSFNPPPSHLRQRGHQFYLQITTLEGETLILVCVVQGWYVSRSTSHSFDSTPRNPSLSPVHSLIDLLHSLSPMFSERLYRLQPLSTTPPPSDPVSTVSIPQAQPAYPFLVNAPSCSALPSVLRTQLAYLHTGAVTVDALDGARDWNEELQGVKELPRLTMHDKVTREKVAQKTWADFTVASVRAVQAVSRGDIPALNPTEDPRAHMYLVSNIFITKALNSMDTYSHIGGDAGAYASHGKDAAGNRLLHKLDVPGLHLLGHTVVDWMGDRWTCQSVLPGIFSRHHTMHLEDEAEQPSDTAVNGDVKKDEWVEVKQPPNTLTGEASSHSEEEVTPEEVIENPLVVYGLDSEQPATVHWDASIHKMMSKVAESQNLASHIIKDRHGKDFEFYASAEVKVLSGTDGRNYVLDVPRLSPVDIEWLEKDMEGNLLGTDTTGPGYPHRLVLLRPELVETFWDHELKHWAREQAKRKVDKVEHVHDDAEIAGPSTPPPAEAANVHHEKSIEDAADRQEAQAGESEAESTKKFQLAFNPDAFVDQPLPKGAEDQEKLYTPTTVTDESDPSIKAVRNASVFLRTIAVPALVLDAVMGNLVTNIMDGQSMSKVMQARGINVRYLGHLAVTIEASMAKLKAQEGQSAGTGLLSGLRSIVLQEMVFRASKHVLRSLLTGFRQDQAALALSHFLNCLLGTSFNDSPKAEYQSLDLDEDDGKPFYATLNPTSLRNEIVKEIQSRFRFDLPQGWFDKQARKPQLLRELATRVGFQLLQREYQFEVAIDVSPAVNGHVSPSKDKKAGKLDTKAARTTTFEPTDIVSIVPIVKSTAPNSTLAEEIFEYGRATIHRGPMELGLEFLLESVQLYESIHSVIHPQVAAAYNQYALTIHSLARMKIQQMASENANPEQPLGLDISTALRLQRQAVIIAERTLGVYTAETCSYYFNLAMLESLEGNALTSLKYFRHVLEMWNVIYGPGHPETNTILSNAAVVLQTLSDHKLSLALLQQVHDSTSTSHGPEHVATGQSLNQLTQAHFLAGDVQAALTCSEQAHAIFAKVYGEQHPQSKESARNIEVLKAVADNVERQKVAGLMARDRHLERLHLAQARVGGGPARRQLMPMMTNGTATQSGVNGDATKVNGQAHGSRIGERGHLEVDELVNFIQGTPNTTSNTNPARAKHSLRGKRRTGAKR